MKKEKKGKVQTEKKIKTVLIVLIICLILSIIASVIDFIVSNNIHLAKTVVIQSSGSLEQPDGSFMIIKDEYGPLMDSSVDFKTAAERWNLALEYGDSVFVIYRLLSYEISPQPIEIYFMIKL